MTRVDDFDAFYHAGRTPLLHQTYAVTGDVVRAASAVEHAFANAWSQWRKVRRFDDPIGWVRNDAWREAASQLPLRRRRRPWRRSGGEAASDRHEGDLAALMGLPDGQRKVVVLYHLARLPIDRIAREVGISEATASSLLVSGEQSWGDGRTTIATALANIGGDVQQVRLIRAPSLRRAGEKRYRQQTLVGVVTASALLAAGGLLIVNDSGAPVHQTAARGAAQVDAQPPASRTTTAATGAPDLDESGPEPFLLDEGALLTPTEMGRLTRPHNEWTTTSTTNGTTGDPIYADCQQQPFADPDGSQSLLRRFRSDARSDDLRAVQVLEESRNEKQAARAFDTMESWYGRCADDGVQLLNTTKVRELGDEAVAFRLRRVGTRDTYLTVGVVRTGPITTAVIASTRADRPVAPPRVLNRAGVSVTRTCLPVSGDCSTLFRTREVPPLPTNEDPGFLAAYDLPSISNVTAPWVGTDPERSPDDPAATPCERATFGKPQKARNRVFVLPTAKKLPRRFGLSETVGTFANRKNARQFIRRAEASARACPDRELSASVPNSRALPDRMHGHVWRFEFEVDRGNSVFYRVGLVRSGRRVAVVSMSPSERYDVAPPEFTALMLRAGQRLSEAR
ncbi:MAG: sigma factor-like helix-turn-helix DNA-binding protein [Nocardioidaceae bacterium]